MRKAKKESFFKKFQKKRREDPLSTDEEIIKQVSQENNYHPADNLECALYVHNKLASLQKYDRERKEATQKLREEQKISKREAWQKQDLLKEAKEKELGDKIREAIHEGEISKEDLADSKYKFEGISPRKFGFGPPR